MKFDELDRKMRVYETAHDHRVLPGMLMVARIDGRSFTRLTRERHSFEAPYDARVRDMMVATVAHLMDCGFGIVYGYTQSDEISLLFHKDDDTFGRKLRKLESILAGEASAKFSLLLGDLAAFDCRISQLPNESLVIDYFRWRHEDAHRNSLTGHCYWLLRKRGMSDRAATSELEGKGIAYRNELLFQSGVNFNELPAWQKRGVGVYWVIRPRIGANPITGHSVAVDRRTLYTEYELPMGEDYARFVGQRVTEASHPDT